MSSAPSPLDVHAETLRQRGAVIFLERGQASIVNTLLAILQLKCALAVLVCVPGCLAFAVSSARDRTPDDAAVSLCIAGALAVVGLGAMLGYHVLGWMQRRDPRPHARALELSRYGLRVCAQGAPADDAALLPWTAWRDVTHCAVVEGSLSFALLAQPGWITLSMTSAGAEEARALALALWTEASQSRS
jgi:hypothetical protein